MLILRTCRADLTSRDGFKWPQSGPVEAPDWSPEPKCGQGLHGLAWGEGDGWLLNWQSDATWLVVEVDADEIVDLGGKIKFPRGDVIFSGGRRDATDYLLANGGQGRAVIGCTLCAGDDSTLTAGDDSTLTGGKRSTLTGGKHSTLTAGDDSTLTGGYRSMLTAGDDSTLTAGDDSTLTGGKRSTLTGGNRSTLTGGSYSTLTGGSYSTLTGGNYSTLTGGNRSTLMIWRRDGQRLRLHAAYVGEDGIEPGKPYRLDQAGKFEVAI